MRRRGCGGSSEAVNETLNQVSNAQTTEQTQKSQMELDSEYIKANYSMSLPLKGTITSRFGVREVEPKNHVGIDIGTNTGAEIVAAMDGVASIVSSEGDYGNHIKITNGNLSTLYAHCNSLDIKEGDNIKKGQKIATVGQTGNATGPHLHFEIILEGRYVNPELVMQF